MTKSVLATTVFIASFCFAASSFAASTTSYPIGNAKAGQKKAATCAACHGADGNSTSPMFPKLAGQSAAYIVKQLKDFKSGTRKNAIMQGMASALNEQDMRDLAAWFASQSIQPGTTDPTLVDKGRAIYKGGITDAKVPACAACHGPAGQGMGPAAWPALAGQHAQYIVTQLEAWRDRTRTNDPHQMMEDVAQNLTDAQIKALASYVQGLHPVKAGIKPQ